MATAPPSASSPPAQDDAVDAADDEVDRCSTPAGSPATSPCSPPATATRSAGRATEFHGQDGYWRTFWDDDVFYGHVLGCKGLERRAVVLCLNEARSRDRARERLYVGMSRATDMLVVVGDPDVVRQVGGRGRGAEAGVVSWEPGRRVGT